MAVQLPARSLTTNVQQAMVRIGIVAPSLVAAVLSAIVLASSARRSGDPSTAHGRAEVASAPAEAPTATSTSR